MLAGQSRNSNVFLCKSYSAPAEWRVFSASSGRHQKDISWMCCVEHLTHSSNDHCEIGFGIVILSDATGRALAV